MLHVLLITNIPSPYMVAYLKELSKYCNVTALFELERASDRDRIWYTSISESGFEAIFLKALRIGNESGLSFRQIKYLSSKKFDRIVISNPCTPTGVVSIAYCKQKGIPFYLQSEGGFQGTGKGLKERFKKFLLSGARGYLTGMGGPNDYFLSYGATPERLLPYPFSSLHESEILDNVPSQEEKVQLKKHLGLHGKGIVLAVGQFIYRKGFDLLIKASRSLPPDWSIYFVGGVPSREYHDLLEEYKSESIYFIDFCDHNKLKQYYLASDIFVLPTREDTWGLVVNEAMAVGLPVITTNRCVAGIELINDGENGLLIQADDMLALADGLSKLACDATLRLNMGKHGLETIRKYSIENMAKTIYQSLITEL